jgi:hypothetical protein
MRATRDSTRDLPDVSAPLQSKSGGMNTTQHISAAEPEPSFGDEVAEFLPWVAAVVVLAPITLLSLMLWAPFLLLLALVVAPVAVAGLIGLAGAILATPYVLLRHWRQHHAERRPSLTRSPVISGALAHTNVGGRQ